MLVFSMNVDLALKFYEEVARLGLTTEEEKVKLLLEMATINENIGVSQTNRTKEQYVKDMSKEFKVLDATFIKGGEDENGTETDKKDI